LRQTADSQMAADISQAVFIVFIRRIHLIRHARALPSWFLQTTRYAVRDARRSVIRRGFHERRAARLEQVMNSQSAQTHETPPLIDEAVAARGPTARQLVLMRYMQGRDFPAIASELGITEQTTRKRLERALERMRRFFGGRGAALSVGGVTAL